MALVKEVLEQSLLAAMKKAEVSSIAMVPAPDVQEQYAKDVSTAIDLFVRTATVSTGITGVGTGVNGGGAIVTAVTGSGVGALT